MNSEELDQGSAFFPGASKRKSTHIIVIGVTSLIIAVVLISVAGFLYGCTGGKVPFDHGIVIDAGSTHTETFLYQWLGSKDHGTGDVTQKDSCPVDGGIAVLPDPTVIVSCVSNITESVPKMGPPPPLYLGATAGMRLLRLANPKQADLILIALRHALQQAKVDVELVDIIEGYEEGTSAWITVNYLLKSFCVTQSKEGVDPSQLTSNALDMGGASTQVAFAVDPSFKENHTHITELKLYGHKYSVVSESFLCFGLMQAFYRHQALLIEDLDSTKNVIDPCLPKGNFSKSIAYSLLGGPCTETPKFEQWLEVGENKKKEFTFEGSSDFENCKKNISNLLDSTACASAGFQYCPQKFSLAGAPNKFVAFSSYYYMTKFLNSTDSSLQEFLTNTEDWCLLTWDQIKHHDYKKSDLPHLTQYCFGALYLSNWLTSIYGFDEESWENITFQQKIDKSDVGWALGFMINATNAIPEEAPSSPLLSIAAFAVLMICGIGIATLGIIFIRKYCNSGYRYSQLKN